MIKAIIFDLGGVLVTTSSSKMMTYFAKTFHITKGEFIGVYKQYESLWSTGQFLEKDLWNKIATDLHLATPSIQTSLWLEGYFTTYQRKEDVIEIAKKLKQNGYNLAILSNIEPPIADFIRKQNWSEFETFIFSCEVGYMKPDMRIYELALKKMHVTSSETIYIDDKTEYVKAAEDLGIHSILFQNAQQLSTDLHALHLFS